LTEERFIFDDMIKTVEKSDSVNANSLVKYSMVVQVLKKAFGFETTNDLFDTEKLDHVTRLETLLKKRSRTVSDPSL